MFSIAPPALQGSPFTQFGSSSKNNKQRTLPKNLIALLRVYQQGLERERLALQYIQNGRLSRKEQLRWRQLTGGEFPGETISNYVDVYEKRFNYNQIAALRSLAPSQVDGLRGIFSLILEPQGRKERALLEKTFIRVLKETDPKRNSALQKEVALLRKLEKCLKITGLDEERAFITAFNVYNTMRELKGLLGERIINLFIALAPTEFVKKPWKPFTG